MTKFNTPQACFDRLKALRSELPTLDLTPITNPDDSVLDYAAPLLKIQAAITNLDESCPNAQRQRTLEAFRILDEGMEELLQWFQAKGISVEEVYNSSPEEI